MAKATAKPAALTVTKMDVWIAEIPDQPGGLAGKLQSLADAGANLDFAVARRQPDKPGVCHQIIRQVAEAGINLRGMSALGLGAKCAVLLAFDSAADATKAARVLAKPAT